MHKKRSSIDRRSGHDRRGWQAQRVFPFTDKHGTKIESDRRAIVERRIDYPEHLHGDRRKPIVSRG